MAGATQHKPASKDSRADASAVFAAVRFLRMLRYRRQYVILAIVVAAALGGLYYLTAQRIYESRASLLVTQTGSDVWNTSLAAEGGNGLMPTCERLVKSAVVLNSAVRNIAQLPHELRVDFAELPRHKWADLLRKKLSATAFRRTNLIELSYCSKSPQSAQAVMGAVVQSYLAFMDENHKNVSLEIVSVLDRERADIEQQLIAKQRQVLEVQHRVRDLGLHEGSNIVHPAVQRVLQLNDTLVEVKKRRVQLEASLQAIHAARDRGVDLRHHLIGVEPLVGRQMMMSALGLTPEASENVNQVERMLIKDKAQLDMLLAHYGRRHPDVMQLERAVFHAEQYLADNLIHLNERLAGLQADELGPMLSAMVQQQLSEAKSHEAQLAAEIELAETEAVNLNDRMAELRIAEDELERLSGFHKSLLNKITAIDINQNRADVRLAVVSEPTLPDRPVAPRLAIVGLLCLVGGVGCGVVVAYVLDLLDDRFRSPEELSQQLDTAVLALVRRLPATDAAGAAAVYAHTAPRAVENEAFRTLRTTLSLTGDDVERIAITSSAAGDGKTTVLANLAVACAQAGKRTLLIDADLRRPGLSKLLDVRGAGGLSEILRSRDDVAQLCRQRVQPSGAPGLDVLPSGPRPSDPAELLSRPRMGELIAWAEDAYDQILIDCPPLLAASDVALIGRLVDGVLLVVQPQKNHRRVVIRAAESLRSLGIKLLGVVANLVGDAKDANYYGYGADYGQDYGYGRDAEDADDEDAGDFAASDGAERRVVAAHSRSAPPPPPRQAPRRAA